MAIQLSDHFTYKKLLKFTIPSIIMLVFTSVYTVVDGFFVSNFVGKTPFAALNLIWPVIQAVGVIGFMFGTGGSALVSKLLGEGKKEKANAVFSMLVYVSLVVGIVVAVVVCAFLKPIAIFLGAEGEMIHYCVLYGRILIMASIAFLLQIEFQSFLVVAEKPKLGLVVTVAAGITNIVLDMLFMVVLKWGLAGAALATGLSQVVGGIIPLFYFILCKDGMLHLTKTKIDMNALFKACTNGASEMMTNLSMSLVSVVYNFQLLKFAGENGLAAYGVIMYLNFIFTAVFLGYSVGSAPIISYHYGAQNHYELHNLTVKSNVVTAVFAVMMALLSFSLARPLSLAFVGYDAELFEITKRGMTIYCFSFLLAGFNIFSSAFFTALNNGAVSAAISFLRTLVFQIIPVLILPAIWGLDGIWISVVVSEFMAIIVSLFFYIKMQPKYKY